MHHAPVSTPLFVSLFDLLFSMIFQTKSCILLKVSYFRFHVTQIYTFCIMADVSVSITGANVYKGWWNEPKYCDDNTANRTSSKCGEYMKELERVPLYIISNKGFSVVWLLLAGGGGWCGGLNICVYGGGGGVRGIEGDICVCMSVWAVYQSVVFYINHFNRLN